MMARFDLAMENLGCPLARRTHPWDMLQAGQHADKTALIEDLTQRELLDWAFAQWNRIQSKLDRSQSRLRHVLELIVEGYWEWHIPTGDVFFSDNWLHALGYTAEEAQSNVEFWESILHPDDLRETKRQIQRHFDGETEISIGLFTMLLASERISCEKVAENNRFCRLAGRARIILRMS